MKKNILSVLSIVVLIFLTGCQLTDKGEENKTGEKTKVTLSMGYIPNIQFTPFYVAQEKGYFAERGLEVEFDYGIAPDLIQLVGSGEKQFAITDGEQVFLGRAQDIPIKAIMAYYQRVPASIVSLAETNISKPEDLKGKKVGIPGLYGASYTALLAFLADQNIDQDEVQIESIGYTQIESLIAEKVQAVVVFSNNEPIQLKDQGYDINEINTTDFIMLAGASLITNENMINNSPKQVEGVVQAIRKGMEYTKNNPDQAFDLATLHIPDLAEDSYPVQKEILTATIIELQGGWTDTKGLGYFESNIWNTTQEYLQELSLLDSKNNYAAQAYTYQFLED